MVAKVKFLLFAKQNTLLSASLIVMLMIFLSRVLGLVRYRLLAHFFGDQLNLLDSFIAAAIVPEAIFEIFIFGTISIAFIPVFSNLIAQKREEDAHRLVTSLAICGLIVFLVVSIILFLGAPQIASLIAPGLVAKSQEQHALIANLIRVMILSQLFFVPGTILTGVAQTFRYFLLPALSPVLYNIGIILGIIFLSDTYSIYAPAIGMVFGAMLFLLAQTPLIRIVGLKFNITHFYQKGVLQVLSLSLPRTLALIANRINDFINIALASLVSQGSIVIFNFAQTLQLAPLSIFGMSLAQALLPTLALVYGKKDTDLFKSVFLSAMHQLLFIIFPIAAILAVLRIPVVRLTYGASNFPWETTVATGQVLIVFSFSLAAQGLNILLTRAFYATHDTKTPLLVTVGGILLNIILSFYFIAMRGFSIPFLAVSFSISQVLQATFLLLLLSKKLGGFDLRNILLPVGKIATSAFLMAIALYIPMKLLDQLVFDTTRTVPLIFLTGIAGSLGLIVYAFFAWLFDIKEIFPVIAFIRKFGRLKKITREVEVINGQTRSGT